MSKSIQNEIIISDDEIKVNIPFKREPFILLINVLLLAAYCCLQGLLAAEFYPLKINHSAFTAIPGVFLGLVFGYGFIQYMSGNRQSFVFDKKYLIIYNNTQRVFKMSDISDLTVNTHYRKTFWRRWKAFWTRSIDGCIGFRYDNRPFHIGYGLSVEEADNLLKALHQKGWINPVQYDIIVEKKGENLKKWLPIIIGLFVLFILFPLMPYIFRLISPGAIYILFGAAGILFIVAIISAIIYNRKNKQKTEKL